MLFLINIHSSVIPMSILDLTAFTLAIKAFEEACAISQQTQVAEMQESMQSLIRAGVIQHFESTYELSWKMMKRWLEKNFGSQMIDGVSRRELYRLAAESQLIDDVEQWMYYHQARNRTSHTYHEETADEIYHSALRFVPLVKALHQQLVSKND